VFCSLLAAIKDRRVIFIDESFCKTGMRREFGWSPRGQRVHGTRPQRSWKTVSIIGAIRIGKAPRLMTHRGAVNGTIFRRFVRTCLVPFIRPGDLVVMDNLNMHKSQSTKRLIEAAGGVPVYLPTYSPELNPIELLWAHLKRELRRLAIDSEQELRAAVRRLRRRVPKSHIAGWFRRSLGIAHRFNRSRC
jgi:transposase